MSIFRTLNTGAAGIRSHTEAIGVTGDNIANMNSIGFKGSRAEFQDVLGRSVAGSNNINTPGAGSKVAHIEQMWSQGALLTTDVPTDMAISGNGFFAVSGNVGGMEGMFFSRAGQFHINNDGDLVNPDGLKLQGFSANAAGTVSSERGDLRIAGETVPANPSTEVNLAVNLDAEAAVPAAWDPTDPDTTSNFSTNITVYDSIGNSHEVTTYFRKTATAGEFEWHSMVDGGDLAGGTPGTPTEGASGTVTFNTSGALASETTTASSWDFARAASGQTIAFNFGTSLAEDSFGTGLDGSTSFAAASTTTGLSQNGYGAGTVSGIGIAADGIITGVFSNGQRRTLGQVALADFASIEGLARVGQGLWTETMESGDANIDKAETGGRGSIVSGALEQSNVDMSKEFIDLIAYQRGLTANTKVVQAADQVLMQVTQLKR